MSDLIGPYEIIEQIGAGGMATVYKARQPKLDRYVALKIMHQMFSADSSFLARFEREARVIARLDHPNIVPVYDYDQHNGQPYIVMKLLEGKTLKEILAERTLPLEDIRRMMVTIADALTYAHEMGVLHRDIKPSNVMIDGQGHPYLMDFGLARIVRQGESTMSVDTMLGTPQYISPEQAQGSPDMNARTDVYSLGVILYDLVAGRVPFVGETAYAIIHKHIYAAPPAPSELNPEVPPAVDAVLLKALAKDPDDRYATPNDLIRAFESAIATSGLQRLDDSRVEQARRLGENLSERTPGGGKYVSIPAAIGGLELKPGSWNQFVEDIGERFRAAYQDVRSELEKHQVVEKLASGVREVAAEVKEAISQSGVQVNLEKQAGGGHKIQIVQRGEVEKLINKDWATDPESVRRRVQKRVDLRRGFFIHLVIYMAVMIILFQTQPDVQAGLSALFDDPGFIEETGLNFLRPLATLNYAAVVALAWGAGVIGHAIQVFYKTGRRLERRRRAFLGELEAYYGPGWADEIDARSYKRIRHRVNDRFKQRAGLVTHFVSAIATSLAVIVGWSPIYQTLVNVPDVQAEMLKGGLVDTLLASQGTVPVLFLLLMMATVFFHAVGSGISAIMGAEANERTIVREMERERELSRIGSAYKRKNEDAYGDDPYPEKRKLDEYKSPIGDSPRVRLTGDGEFTQSFIEDLEQDAQRRQR